QGHLPRLPFGTDLSEEEVVLVGALRALRRKVAAREVKAGDFEHLKEALAPPAAARPYLRRMGLEEPRGLAERGMQKVVLFALSLVDAL
ncbi:MAG TPA: hypothetical protein VMT16_12180, partial [Thermoanaerobaculia bacterium]|nr:hypothetical protein [Thermoanaerobaculia bacterium]